MSYYSFLLFLLLYPTLLSAQCAKLLDNGLLYSDSTLQPLSQAIDSLHTTLQQHKNNQPTYQSLAQGKGFYVRKVLKKGAHKQRQAIIQALQQQISLNDFKEQYAPVVKPEAIVIEIPRLVTRDQAPAKTVFYFYQINPAPGEKNLLSMTEEIALHPTPNASRWVYQWKQNVLEAFYFPTGLHMPILSPPYGDAAHYTNALLNPDMPLALHHLSNPPNAFNMHTWFFSNIEEFQFLSTIQQQTLIDSLRKMKIVVGCGADESLCYHARILANLTALTGNYSLFIKAHLEAIDNYSMVYDLGYYKESEHARYHSGVQELEQLNIDLTRLTIGLLLHTSSKDFSNKRYYRQVLERFLVYAKERESILQQVAFMMQDEQLDALHRRTAAAFYQGFLFHIPKEDPLLQQHITQYKTALHRLPSFLQDGLRDYPSTQLFRNRGTRRGQRN